MPNPDESEEASLQKSSKHKNKQQDIPLEQVSQIDVEPTTIEQPNEKRTQLDTGNPEGDKCQYMSMDKPLGRTGQICHQRRNVSAFLSPFKFICSSDLMQSAFRLFGGKAAGKFFSNDAVLSNPLAGLMTGILTNVLVQSSSTSTSIVVSMVASDIIDVKTAIPIVMGANIGTSVTNTIVLLTQSPNREEFRRAFAAATVHDMFNWHSVLVMLALEVITGYLLAITSAIVDSYKWKTSEGADKELLNVITYPFTNFVIQLDKEVVLGVALGNQSFKNRSMMRQWCNGYKSQFDVTQIINKASNEHRCCAIFNQLELSDTLTGAILIVNTFFNNHGHMPYPDRETPQLHASRSNSHHNQKDPQL